MLFANASVTVLGVNKLTYMQT